MENHSADIKSGAEKGPHITIYIAAILAVAAVVISAFCLFKNPGPREAGAKAVSEKANSTAKASLPPAVENTNPATHPVASGNRLTTEMSQPDSDASRNRQKSLQELGKLLRDASLSGGERQMILTELVQNGSTEALKVLQEALASGPEELRTAIAEALGNCSSPECKQMLLGMLKDPSEAVARSAIRALANQDSPEGVQALAECLYDSQLSLDVRAEAVGGLGTMKQSGALDTLTRAATTMNDSEVVTEILNALGARDFNETKDFFLNYLQTPNLDSELRMTAVEALAQAQGNPIEFLASLLTDRDSDVRAAAAWALSATDTEGNARSTLIARLQSETDPDVRLRLYQALRNQENFDVQTVISLVQQERDPSARIAGFDLLAKTVRDDPAADTQKYFEQTGVPLLTTTALKGESGGDRMAAVLALARAGTPTSLAALQDIAQQSTDPKVKQAASGNVPGAQTATK